MAFVASVCCAGVAYSHGATSSGGGNTYNNSGNPWFLENTLEVTYCLEIDEETMGVSESDALATIQDVIAAWKHEFANADSRHYAPGELAPYDQVRVATQTFIYTECTEDTDLRFQLGTLTADQASLLDFVDEVVGIAFRTSYDTQTLRGRGFIYISPQSGPLRPQSSQFAESPWTYCNGCLLKGAIKHELGHVFGLKHQGTDDFKIMSRDFLALLTSKSLQDEISSFPPALDYVHYVIQKPFFRLVDNPIFIGKVDPTHPQEKIYEIFDLQPDEEIIRVRAVPSSTHPGATDYAFEASDMTMTSWAPLGKLCWTKSSSTGSTAAVHVYLDRDQTVFTQLPTTYFFDILAGPSREFDYYLNGSFCSDRGTPRVPILIHEGEDRERRMSTVIDFMIQPEWFDDKASLRH